MTKTLTQTKFHTATLRKMCFGALVFGAAIAGCSSPVEDTYVLAPDEQVVEVSLNGVEATLAVPQEFTLDEALVDRFESLSLPEGQGYTVRAWAGRSPRGDVLILSITDSVDNVFYNGHNATIDFDVPFSEDEIIEDSYLEVPGALKTRLVVGRTGEQKEVTQLVSIARLKDTRNNASWVMLGVNQKQPDRQVVDRLVETLVIKN